MLGREVLGVKAKLGVKYSKMAISKDRQIIIIIIFLLV